ncbi:ABC transporter permease [Belliella sp. DSM 107340]|uniref:ABC transporter permease n=1 Tax=Belliella calami TaxID=2923436 RepID=A0ABS9UT42_9BACT|nr:ABC transporter permease [Belliella calami]MCH7399779.1 ABC transporter permease [Belliella calami]
MYSNYLKIALRGLTKHKLTFFINLFGLALGLWATITISLWVKSELNMNASFPEIDQVYRIMEHQRYGSEFFTTSSTPGILAPALKAEFPEVERAACYSWNEDLLFIANENRFNLNGFYAEPDYLHIMQYEFLHGDRDKAMTEKNHIVLTKESAIKLFGQVNVVGESLVIKETGEESSYIVVAVIDIKSYESSASFEFIIPFQVMLDKPYNEWLSHWGNNGPSTIVRLNKNVDWEAFSASIEDLIVKKNEGSNIKLFAYPQRDLYLHGKFKDGIQQGGRIEYVKLFALIGLFVLLIACINFMNLSTAKSQKRAKEVGVRKVVGAEKNELVLQFLTESMLVTFIAGFVSLIFVELSLPIFNNLTGKTLSVPYGDWVSWVQFIMILLFTGLVAGSYPAFYLSATKVVMVFRNFTKSGKGVVIARKGLVLFQFILATMLIIATIVVYKQINFAMNKNLGYEKDQLVSVFLEGSMYENFEVYKRQVEEIPGVLAVTRSNHSLMGRNSNTGGISWEGKDPDFSALFEIMSIDYGFVEAMGMKMIKGEDFSPDRVSDSINKVILNRRAYEMIAQDDPDPVSIKWGTDVQILGVVEDFHFQSLHLGMEPVILRLDPDNSFIAYFKIASDDVKSVISEIKYLSESFEPDFPFQFSFMDENYSQMYQEDLRTKELAKYFSILTILISCLGLFGLSAHVAEQKTKEIGIRKVLGASTLSILNVINREFIMIVSISILFGSGIAYWLMQDWLEAYAYRVDFEWWFIPLAAVGILVIAFLTVSLQALKAAQINPVRSLKSE